MSMVLCETQYVALSYVMLNVVFWYCFACRVVVDLKRYRLYEAY